MAVYVWYGRNREGGRQASGCVEELVKRNLQSRASSAQDELV